MIWLLLSVSQITKDNRWISILFVWLMHSQSTFPTFKLNLLTVFTSIFLMSLSLLLWKWVKMVILQSYEHEYKISFYAKIERLFHSFSGAVKCAICSVCSPCWNKSISESSPVCLRKEREKSPELWCNERIHIRISHKVCIHASWLFQSTLGKHHVSIVHPKN